MKAFRDIKQALISQLAANWSGAVNAAAVEFPVRPADVVKLAGLNWESPRQVFFGDRSIDDIENSTTIKRPISIVTVPGLSQLDGQAKIYGRISGLSDLVVRLYLEWVAESAEADAEAYSDLACEAFVELFSSAFQAATSNAFGWTGALTVSRGQILRAGANWRQEVAFVLTFKVEG